MDSTDSMNDSSTETTETLLKTTETAEIQVPQSILESSTASSEPITDLGYTVEPQETVLEINKSNPTHSTDTLITSTTSTPIISTSEEKDTNLNLSSSNSNHTSTESNLVTPSTTSQTIQVTGKKSTSPERQLTAPAWFCPPLPRSISYANPNSASSPSSSSTTTSSPSNSSPPPRPRLDKTFQSIRAFLKTFLIFIPSCLRKLKFLFPSPLITLARAIFNRIAPFLPFVMSKKPGESKLMGPDDMQKLFYDFLVAAWTAMISIFFREIRSRGAWKIPVEGEGAVIFVVGPHHNQFLDPCLLTSEVRRESGRRISFLVAEASMSRRFIGTVSKLMQSIPVTRAQDLAITGKGTVSIDSEDPCIIVGLDTTFLTDFAPRKQIMLARSLGNASAEVIEVLDDNRLRIKKEFNKKVTEGLKLKPEGSTYKIVPHVDQSKMYSSVYQKLMDGGCIAIFPEGGSHDRTDLLPLKAGVSIMALGALSANPSLRLRIVPVGLSYFHPHKFRSRAVVEFGSPIEIPKEFVEDFEKGGEMKRSAIAGMLELVVDGLKSVTVRAPDYETLMLIQATRRLYRPPGQHLTLGQIVELNKRFIAGYEVYKDDPKLKALTTKVKEYNTLLRYMGLKDHQIERVTRPLWRSIILLCYRICLVSAWGILALPGVVLNAPIFIAAKYISKKKAKAALAASTVKIKGNDVLATWKVLVGLAGAPALYSVYAVGATYLAFRYDLPRKYKIYAPIATMAGLPLIGYSALKFGEVGVDIYKSLRPLFLSVIPGNEKQLDKLRTMRAVLQHDISVVVNEFGPQLFEDFKQSRIISATASVPPLSPSLTKRRSTYGPQGQGTFFNHPMSWIDEYLFSGSKPQKFARSGDHDSDGNSEGGAIHSGYVSGYQSEEAPDYDEVIHILSREQGTGPETPQPAGSEVGGSRYRRSSRSRSRSHLDLTALQAAVEKQSRDDVEVEGGKKLGGVRSSSRGREEVLEMSSSKKKETKKDE